MKITPSMINKKKRKFNVQISKLFTLQYFPAFYERLKYKPNSLNIYFILKHSIKLKIHILFKKIDEIEPNQLSGVYEIPFIKDERTMQFT